MKQKSGTPTITALPTAQQKASPGKTLVGTITIAERDEIMGLNYRRQTLQTFLRSMGEEKAEFNLGLYEKLIEDMSQTQMRYDRWFREKSQQHGWKSVDGMNWSVDFDSCEIFLI